MPVQSTSEDQLTFDQISSASQLYSEFVFFLLATIYICLDLYYPLWVWFLKMRAPKTDSEYFSNLYDAMLGMTMHLKDQVGLVEKAPQ